MPLLGCRGGKRLAGQQQREQQTPNPKKMHYTH
jgi:hypothetical protein